MHMDGFLISMISFRPALSYMRFSAVLFQDGVTVLCVYKAEYIRNLPK